ncbi:hypothetical protein FRC01_007667, partial [Tulasnella sp. 417]
NEKSSTLLLNFTALAGRRYLYRVVPNVAYIEPNEEVVVKVTRGKIKKHGPEGEWRDVLGIESIRAIDPPEPQDPEYHPPTADEQKQLWARAVRTGLHISSRLVRMDHGEPPGLPEIVITDESYDKPVPEGDEEGGGNEALRPTSWREIEKPGNWVRFHSTGDFTNTYFSALYWKLIERREAQQCVIRRRDGEDIHPVKMAMKWLVDADNRAPAEDGAPRSLVGRAVQEFRIWRELKHPHIAPLYGIVIWPNVGFLSPYCTNGRLLQYIVDQKLSWEVRIRLMEEIASALQYLHEEKNIVYGDLKEDNVLIDHNQRAILIDFGLSMTAADAQVIPSLTGHIRYMAPEVAALRKKSFKSDVYAYGLLILEMGIGRRARDEAGADHIAAASAYYFPSLRGEHYPELRKSKSNVLWAIIGDCTERTPYKRPPMRAIASRLSKISPPDWMPEHFPS